MRALLIGLHQAAAPKHGCAYCRRSTWLGTIVQTRGPGGGLRKVQLVAPADADPWLQATVDHYVALVHGGAARGPNAVLACRSCNGIKGGKTVAQWWAYMARTPEWWLVLPRRQVASARRRANMVAALAKRTLQDLRRVSGLEVIFSTGEGDHGMVGETRAAFERWLVADTKAKHPGGGGGVRARPGLR